MYGGSTGINSKNMNAGYGSTGASGKDQTEQRYNSSVFGNGQVVGGETAFVQDVRELRPPVNLDSGAIYEGEWLNGVRDGHGKQEWLDGSRYDGQW